VIDALSGDEITEIPIRALEVDCLSQLGSRPCPLIERRWFLGFQGLKGDDIGPDRYRVHDRIPQLRPNQRPMVTGQIPTKSPQFLRGRNPSSTLPGGCENEP